MMSEKKLIPLHGLLDKCLGFSIKDLVLNTPEEKEEFKKRLGELIKELEAEEAEAEKDHDGKE